MDDDNFYGTHYLTDLVRALDYTGADLVGKWAHLVHLESSGATLLRFGRPSTGSPSWCRAAPS